MLNELGSEVFDMTGFVPLKTAHAEESPIRDIMDGRKQF